MWVIVLFVRCVFKTNVSIYACGHWKTISLFTVSHYIINPYVHSIRYHCRAIVLVTNVLLLKVLN